MQKVTVAEAEAETMVEVRPPARQSHHFGSLPSVTLPKAVGHALLHAWQEPELMASAAREALLAANWACTVAEHLLMLAWLTAGELRTAGQ